MLRVAIKSSVCDEALAKAFEFSVPWRPLIPNTYKQQYNGPSHSKLISFQQYDAANKAEIVQMAQHNAHILQKYKEIGHHVPITSYSNPFQLYTQSPGLTNKMFTTSGLYSPQQGFIQQQNIHPNQQSHQQYPVKPLYHTKLTFLGKPELNSIFQQNSIHQTVPTTPKIAGYTKENGKIHIHYHHPQFGMTPITTTKRNPVFR